jgi:hypothetical protein
VPTVFAVVSLHKVLTLMAAGYFGIDFRVYRAAALAALGGGDPWLATTAGQRFGGPPPTLLAYLPAAFLPEIVGVAVYLGLSVAAAALAVRALRLPWWWLLFPPIVESVVVLNPDVLVLALLVAGGRFAGFGVPLKVYAAIPLLLQRRFAALALGGAICVVTLPLWPMFVADRAIIVSAFDAQSAGLSAWGTWLVVPALLALVAMRRSGGEWLAVPAIWPYTQLHYAALALPALRTRPALAIALSFGYPFLAPVAIIVQAAWESWRGRVAPEREVPA